MYIFGYGTPWYQGLKDEFVIVGDGVLIKYNGTKSGVILPDNVKAIGGTAFRNNTSVSDVVLHDGIKGIDMIRPFWSSKKQRAKILRMSRLARLTISLLRFFGRIPFIRIPRQMVQLWSWCLK